MTLQCKDIPDEPILDYLAGADGPVAQWDAGLRTAMGNPPDKLVLAKLRRLVSRGLIDGCPCGCRGDFRIARDKGKP